MQSDSLAKVAEQSKDGGIKSSHVKMHLVDTNGTRCFTQKRALTIPEIMLIGGTRVALGVGLGFLVADRLRHDTRKGAGWALLAVGVLSTVPLVLDVLGKPHLEAPGV